MLHVRGLEQKQSNGPCTVDLGQEAGWLRATCQDGKPWLPQGVLVRVCKPVRACPVATEQGYVTFHPALPCRAGTPSWPAGRSDIILGTTARASATGARHAHTPRRGPYASLRPPRASSLWHAGAQAASMGSWRQRASTPHRPMCPQRWHRRKRSDAGRG